MISRYSLRNLARFLRIYVLFLTGYCLKYLSCIFTRSAKPNWNRKLRKVLQQDTNIKNILKRVFLIVFNIVNSLFSLKEVALESSQFDIPKKIQVDFSKSRLHKLHLLSDQLDISPFFTYN